MCIECPHRRASEGGVALGASIAKHAHLCHMQPSQECAGARRDLALAGKKASELDVKVLITAFECTGQINIL